ncbi:aldehyde dehydrogenase family protein [Pseudohaliea sp.]|uniref:aldehyde dehydrogenase family protein n=1 Tax=Pseudohaliea sp. TaxID=2740289 RepID=UPI0032EC76EC
MREHLDFYIDGQWVRPEAPDTLDVLNPATEEVAGRISLGGQADVDRAVAAARWAFESFSLTSRAERLELLASCSEAYGRHYQDIADAIREEMGAPQEVAVGLQAYCGQAILDETRKVLEAFEFESPHGNHAVLREPIGVCGLITPWNWPVNQVAAKVAPALAAGCTVVLKPSELAPLSACVFAQAMHEAGVPAGVFNLVNGDGRGVGSMLSAHEGIDMISFTGSTRAGVLIARSAAEAVKRVALELGGKSPFLVLDGADLDAAVTQCVGGIMFNTGQSCAAPSRLLVPRSKLQAAEAVAKAVAESVVVGDPRAEGVTMGPAASAAQYDKVQRLIQRGIDEGARLVTGGPGKPPGCSVGYFLKPTVFSDVDNSMDIAREEIFGPVLAIIPYDDVEQAVAIANDTAYGLAAYVHGEADEARRVARRLRAGSVYLNGEVAGFDLPFGGYKQSGNGREFGAYGLEEYLELKTVKGFY